MRRAVGGILVGLGVFLLVTAGMLRFYVADRLVVTPINQFTQTVAPGPGTYYDTEAGTERTTDLVATRTLKGDVDASSEDTAVWDVSVVVDTSDGAFVRASYDRVAVDRKTGEAVECCGEAVDSEPTEHSGVSYKFPFDTEQTTYQLWDVNSRRAWPARFSAEEEIQGLTTYKFIQEIPATQLRVQENVGPVVGEPADFDAPVWYQNTRTVWVEPRTGVIVKGSEQNKTTLRNSADEDRVIVLEANFTFDEQTQENQAELAKDGIFEINLVTWILPLVALVLGLAAIVVGVLMLRRSRRPSGGAHAANEQLAPVGGPGAERDIIDEEIDQTRARSGR
jgi:Porin PorA